MKYDFSSRIMRAGAFIFIILWAFWAGKDLSWDVLNHQLYLPFSWLHKRFRTDIFAAGPQSYQNPIGYFPLYALIRIGTPAWIIGFLLAACHGSIVWPLDRIARVFWPTAKNEDLWLRIFSLTLCCVAPIFLIQTGTTSIDPFVNLLVLWSMALTFEQSIKNEGDWRKTIICGVFLGFACALKLSGAIFAVALGCLLLFKCTLKQVSWRGWVSFCLATILTFVALAGPWMYWLWHDFGNPIFPIYNNVFHSPYAPQSVITAIRFLPASYFGVVSRLWELAEPRSYVSYEAVLPDIRPLLVAAIGAAAMSFLLLFRGGWRRLARRNFWCSPSIQLGLSGTLMYLLWMHSSGNARYGMPLLVVCGVCLVRAVQCTFPTNMVKIILLTTCILQVSYYFAVSPYRFYPANWDIGPYVEYRVPQRLRKEPFLHLSIGAMSHSAIALFMHPGGALSNPIGQFALPTSGPLGDRFKALLDRWHGRTRLLLAMPDVAGQVEVQKVHEGLRVLLYRLGLDIDWDDCESIDVLRDRSDLPEVQSANGSGKHSNERLMSCGALYRSDADPVADRQLLQANRVFDILEAACPRVFSPTPFASEHGPDVWERHYMNTEAHLRISETDGVSFSHFRSILGAQFGSIDDVLQHRKPITCPSISYQTPM